MTQWGGQTRQSQTLSGLSGQDNQTDTDTTLGSVLSVRSSLSAVLIR